MSSYRKVSDAADKDGRFKYELNTTYGKDRLTGKPERYYTRVLCTPEQVEDEWILFRASVIQGTFEKKSKKKELATADVPRTVAELCDAYLEDLDKTFSHGYIEKNLRNAIEAHIKPLIGDALIDRVLPLDVQKKYIAGLVDGHHGRQGLAPKTVKNYVSVLSQVFKYGVVNDLLEKNPCDAQKLRMPKRDQSEAGFYTLDEVDRLFSLLQEHADGNLDQLTKATICMVALTTGMRKSEILGLDWTDINFNDCTGRVVKTRYLKKKKDRLPGEPMVCIGDVKTKKSRRLVTFPLETIELLQRLRDMQLEMEVKMGDRYKKSPAVFRGLDGLPMSPKVAQRFFRSFCDKNELPAHGLHGLRHTFASIAVTLEDVNMVDVSRYLGHSQLTTTQNIYVHSIFQHNLEIAQGISKLLNT